MSIKHFAKYYRELQQNYNDMVQGLQELEESCTTQMVTPEMIEQYKLTLQPIKDSFLTMQYVKYLLDMPNKKEKQERYKKQYSKLDKTHYENLPQENSQRIKELKK